jgi:hypothetical protein
LTSRPVPVYQPRLTDRGAPRRRGPRGWRRARGAASRPRRRGGGAAPAARQRGRPRRRGRRAAGAGVGRAPASSGIGRRPPPKTGSGFWRSGNARQSLAEEDFYRRQPFSIHGIGFGRLATLANLWHWIRETGKRRQSLAVAAKDWRSPPLCGKRRQTLATVARRKNPPPKIGKRCQSLAAIAKDWQTPRALGGLCRPAETPGRVSSRRAPARERRDLRLRRAEAALVSPVASVGGDPAVALQALAGMDGGGAVGAVPAHRAVVRARHLRAVAGDASQRESARADAGAGGGVAVPAGARDAARPRGRSRCAQAGEGVGRCRGGRSERPQERGVGSRCGGGSEGERYEQDEERGGGLGSVHGTPFGTH